jgi:nicotinamidase-related amidase
MPVTDRNTMTKPAASPLHTNHGISLRLERDRSALLVIDVQERLVPHVLGHEALMARVEALLGAADRFGIPAFLTEHCPDRIGRVVAHLRGRVDPTHVFVKTHFGALDHPAFEQLLRTTGRTQIVVAGMEAHVCVLQTTLGLVARAFRPFVVSDAVGSRGSRQDDRRCALERLRDAGCTLAGTETVLFEWTRAGDDAAFKEVLALVKALE